MHEKPPLSIARVSDAIEVLTWFSAEVRDAKGNRDPAKEKDVAMMSISGSVVALWLVAYAQARSNGASHGAAIEKAINGDTPIPPHMGTSMKLQMTIAANSDLNNEPPVA